MVHLRNGLEDAFHTSRLGVGDKHLAEAVASHQLHQLRHTHHVEFVKHIVQQQDGLHPAVAVDIFELCKFQCQHKCLLLSLRAVASHRHIAHRQLYIISVGTHGGEECLPVATAGLGQLLRQRHAALGHIGQHTLLAAVGNPAVIVVEQGGKPLEEMLTFTTEHLAMTHQLLIPYTN